MTESNAHLVAVPRTLMAMAAFVVVVAGIQAAQSILVPFLLSVFIAALSIPALFWFTNHGVPKLIAILLVISLVITVAVLLTTLVGASVDGFSNTLPFYQQRISSEMSHIAEWLSHHSIEIEASKVLDYFDPGKVMQIVSNTLSGFGSTLTNSFLILLTVIFILFEASSFTHKLRQISGDSDAAFLRFKQFRENMQRYIAIKAASSLLTGVLIGVCLWIVGVDFPLLWATMAFLLNFVPNIGSIIATIPAILLAYIQLGSYSALLTLAVFLAVNTLVGNFIEPRFMGKQLGLSTLVVFLSLIFWGWVLGPVGMLLSVPLTMTIKIAFESHPGTHWLAVLLGSEDDYSDQTEA